MFAIGWVHVQVKFLFLVLAAAAMTGCRQDTQDQPKSLPSRAITFFADGQSALLQVRDPIARPQGDAGSYRMTGLSDGHPAADRWAVAAYIHALQLRQSAKLTDVPASQPVRELREMAAQWNLLAPDGAGRRRLQAEYPARVTVLPQLIASSSSMKQNDASVDPRSVAAQVQEKSGDTDKQTPVHTGVPATFVYDAASGKQLYVVNCQLCHQANRAGLSPTIPSLVGIVGRVGAEHIRDVVINGAPNGRPPMPAYKLSDVEVSNLIQYLQDAKD